MARTVYKFGPRAAGHLAMTGPTGDRFLRLLGKAPAGAFNGPMSHATGPSLRPLQGHASGACRTSAL